MSVSAAQAHTLRIATANHIAELSGDHLQVTARKVRGDFDGWADVRYRSGKFNHFYAPIHTGLCVTYGVRGEPQSMRLCENPGHIRCTAWRPA